MKQIIQLYRKRDQYKYFNQDPETLEMLKGFWKEGRIRMDIEIDFENEGTVYSFVKGDTEVYCERDDFIGVLNFVSELFDTKTRTVGFRR